MKTLYLGLELSSPVVVASSPYTASADCIRRCVEAGAGAVVLKSIFEEEVLRRTAAYEYIPDAMGDSGEYLERYLSDASKLEYLRLIAAARSTGVPVIASINCTTSTVEWVDYALAVQDAGADAIELNIFLQPSNPGRDPRSLEHAYRETARQVAAAVRIPVSVKLPVRLTNVLATAAALRDGGVRGVVLFNRFFEPDIDIERLRFVRSDPFSAPSELRNVLRWAALAAATVSRLDVAVSTGVHDGEAAVKAILAGAQAVEVCSAIHYGGFDAIGRIDRFIDRWARRHRYGSIWEFRGLMGYGNASDEALQRVQYMTWFPKPESDA